MKMTSETKRKMYLCNLMEENLVKTSRGATEFAVIFTT